MATILVVDDEAPLREFVADVLEEAGHQVLQASNGREALALLASAAPQLVVTDVMMPFVNGLELLQAMKTSASLAAIPVILMPATERRRAVTAGADAVLEKPFTLEALEALVQQWLQPPAAS